MPPVAPRSGDAIFANVERVNAELFTLTYGAIVRQLLTDLEQVEELNKLLHQMTKEAINLLESLLRGKEGLKVGRLQGRINCHL
ncbi:hypothetical protein ACB094_11G186600 [Castanea mollissima]